MKFALCLHGELIIAGAQVIEYARQNGYQTTSVVLSLLFHFVASVDTGVHLCDFFVQSKPVCNSLMYRASRVGRDPMGARQGDSPCHTEACADSSVPFFFKTFVHPQSLFFRCFFLD